MTEQENNVRAQANAILFDSLCKLLLLKEAAPDSTHVFLASASIANLIKDLTTQSERTGLAISLVKENSMNPAELMKFIEEQQEQDS